MQGERPVIWLVQDRWGRDFVLCEDTWYNHILPRHHVLRGYEAAVAEVLTGPSRVMLDAIHPMREGFYRPRTHPEYPELFLKVCVELSSAIDGFVVTAFLTPTIQVDEVQRWP
jgi:hypothetical protein